MNKLLKNKRNMHTHKSKTQHKEEKASIFWKAENIISDKLCLVFFFSAEWFHPHKMYQFGFSSYGSFC